MTVSVQCEWDAKKKVRQVHCALSKLLSAWWLDVIIKHYVWSYPGGAVVENLPANAGDTGSSPGLGRSHMPRSNWAREPQLLSLCVWNLCSTTREAAIVRGPHTAMKSDPRLLQLEKALAQKWRPNTAIKKKNKKKKHYVEVEGSKVLSITKELYDRSKGEWSTMEAIVTTSS